MNNKMCNTYIIYNGFHNLDGEWFWLTYKVVPLLDAFESSSAKDF